ncbi:unnamed protein product [Lactuca saligna]|uniref:Uncharacterized protein n=1 Tax=Lactuca saligna TaxID=75948 RepID=A0AA35Y527_LACSI|nr:unnamed protein product [Lactuca saligna]
MRADQSHSLTLKEEKCEVLETKLHYTQKQVDDLLAEKAFTYSCISDVNGLLSDIIETHDPMISITVRKHLLEKLRPVFAMLHRLEGVSTRMSFPKQGGEGSSKVHTEDVKPKVSVKPPVIKDSRTCSQEAKEKERAEKEAHATLKSKMLLFPKWTLKRMQNQAVDMPSQYWLDPIASFDVQNSQDSQFDLPITLKAFTFHAFIKVSSIPFSDSTGDQTLFNFYLKHMKPQFETWSASKIVVVKVTGLIETESFPNAKFKVARGSARQACKFTLADLPCLTMIKSYIPEVGIFRL